jgi:PAS domain S-box-containing protein
MLEDKNGCITFVNSRIIEISGYSEEELIGKPSIILAAKESTDKVIEEMKKRPLGISSRYEAIFKSKDGLKIPMQVSGSPIFTDTKEFQGALVVLTDITELKRTELEIVKTKARLEYLLKSGPAIIYACEPRGDYLTTYMSENVRDILGHDPENFLYNHSFWVDGIPPEDRQRVTESFSKISISFSTKGWHSSMDA